MEKKWLSELYKKHKNIININQINSLNDIKVTTNKVFLLSTDFLSHDTIVNLKNLFTVYNQTEFVFYTKFGYDYWNLDNLTVLQFNWFMSKTLNRFNKIKKYPFSITSNRKNKKNFSIFLGSVCRPRYDFITFLGYTNILSNAHYSLVKKNKSIYQSDNKKYEFLFGANFETYQETFVGKEYNYKPYSKFEHDKNYHILEKILHNSYFYVALENRPFDATDNVSEKSLYGYISGLPTLHVVSEPSRRYLIELGFKSTSLFEIEKNYNASSLNETMIEYAKDISFLSNLSADHWQEYYQNNSELMHHNFENLNAAEQIINKNILKALDN